jgi:hypothetical protein
MDRQGVRDTHRPEMGVRSVQDFAGGLAGQTEPADVRHPQLVRQVRRLADRVHHEGGTARVVQVQLSEAGAEQALREEFNTARDTEYAEVLERVPALSAEIAMERARGRATYA